MEPVTTAVGNAALPEVEERASIKAWHRFYDRFVAPRFRGRRMALFASWVPVDETTRVIDLGGAENTWRMLAARPHVTMVNRWGKPYANARFSYVIGDACALDVPDNAYDVSFSNSVIEHVGGWDRQQAFAREIRRAAPRYFVQTPYRYFPIEPHFMCLGIQFLPRALFKVLVRWLSLWGLTTRPSRAEIDAAVDEVRLLTARDMRTLFPDARIVRERLFFLTKSLIAVKT